MLRLLLVLVTLLGPAAARAAEEILAYHSEIVVETSGELLVTETIRVRAEGRQIKRGIYRDFPTEYRNADGTKSRTGFDVVEVLRDGRAEPWHTEKRSNGTRLYIGSANALLRRGEYTYTIRYRSPRQLRFFEIHDELYWNATGTAWGFPINRATATVRLPEGALVERVTGYTGPQGARGQDFVSSFSGTVAEFEATRAFRPREGLTVVVAWPKGFVAEPTAVEEAGYLLLDNAPILVGAIGLFVVLCYFLLAWNRVGRDPQGGPIIAQYAPPEGLSPAACQFIRDMGFGSRGYTAAIVSMAVKGYLTIEESSDEKITLKKTGWPAELSPGEKAAASRLFLNGASIRVRQSNHEAFSKASRRLRRALRGEYEAQHFKRNRKTFFIGLALAIVAIAAIVVSGSVATPGLFMAVWLAGWSAGVYVLMTRVKDAWSMAISTGRFTSIFSALFVSAFAIPFVFFWFVGSGMFSGTVPPQTIPFIGLIILCVAIFYFLLKAPTRMGRQVMDDIEGFRKYLSVAEKDRLEFAHPPEKTPELFEKFLPYAIALGVENEWGEQFEDVLRAASTDPERDGYSPSWYHARGGWRGGFSASRFSSAVGGSLTGAIAAASTAPSKGGSGFGGGGSSGGGGGGGGGGGW